MSTLSFAFGMLTMIAVMLIAVIVVGIVKVYKLENKFNKHDLWITDRIQSIVQEDAETRRQLYDHTGRMEESLHRAMESLHRATNDQITDAVTQCNSYTDKRIDQSKNKTKDILKG